MYTLSLSLNTEKPTAKVSPKPYPTLTEGDKLRLTCSVNQVTVHITWHVLFPMYHLEG